MRLFWEREGADDAPGEAAPVHDVLIMHEALRAHEERNAA